MRYKEIVKILQSLKGLNSDQQMGIDLIIADVEETIKWNTYMLIGSFIAFSCLAIGFVMGYFYPLSQYIK